MSVECLHLQHKRCVSPVDYLQVLQDSWRAEEGDETSTGQVGHLEDLLTWMCSSAQLRRSAQDGSHIRACGVSGGHDLDLEKA
ncbi:unnamed protein product [Mesocestoides corti]|uniref:Uncharacterized protein n=1 Tax=Mesocestoides corti TaxID=53468 RepID=A0A3P6HUP6_MESCO|nr:unnamed protein product [Mesocestoides corti]